MSAEFAFDPIDQIITKGHENGVSLDKVAMELNSKGFKTESGRSWNASFVSERAREKLNLRRKKEYVRGVVKTEDKEELDFVAMIAEVSTNRELKKTTRDFLVRLIAKQM